MANSNFTDDQIDDYIMGLLEDDNIEKFELSLDTDDELKARLEERKEFILGIKVFHETTFKNKLKNIHETAFGETSKGSISSPVIAKRRSLMSWFAAAASIALLVVAFMWFNNNGQTSEALYAANFEPHKLSLTKRDNANAELIRLEKFYEAGNYKEALPLFESMIKTPNSGSQLQLGLGISKLELGKTNEALLHFKSILDSGDLLYKDHANWYSALSYLRMDKQKEAKTILKQLADDSTADHHKEAKDLWSKIN